MLTYMDIHLKYTLSVIGVLALITRPFLCRMETTKIAFISTVALLYTTLCYNYTILNGARTYSPEKVSGVIGNIPVDEYISVVLQVVLVSLWAYLCVRWKHQCLNFNHDKQSYQTIRWMPILLLNVTTAIGYGLAVPGQQTFYLGSIMCWASPVIMVMWYGAGNYFVKNLIPSSFAIAIPTLYLLLVNRIALKEDVWHLNKTTSLNVSVANGLPLEEALFTFITTAMIVLAGNCYDKAYSMIITFSLIYPHQFSFSRSFIGQMFKAFATSEYTMPSIVTDDLKYCIKLLDSSHSFGTSNYLFHTAIRLDLLIIYGFTRITDNMVDDESDFENKKIKLKLCYKFINELFADRKSDFDVKSYPQEIIIDWKEYESELTEEELAIFRAFSRIAFLLPRKPFEELFDGFQLDLSGTLYKNVNDLLIYFTLVAGSFGAMCVYIIMYRYNIDKYEFVEKDDYLIRKSYQIGNGLQFVNIARDLVRDSEAWGRCYFPTELLDDEKEDLRILCQEKKPRSMGDKKLQRYARMMIQLADKHQLESVDAINRLPRELRGPILASTEIYRGLNYAIQSSPTFPHKAKLTKYNQLMILFKILYIKSMKYVI
ncbi:bifunctional lycopene cyclase/phytoene synthase-like [Rhopalosiphum maidis]|uniref:bifunctional lycopene cyclase/phytoene synthase-like n=1 Tax=Rhopalosiphum maidis TaxID=43146 RepID=UPI000F00E8A6|nr:bifunctional lycopene cyclase/phytoene synthase-like [Rhopalosiphum maidis]XP_026807315.1 bifunctional lycopene cyclase/phytoene synthase-like [Rhopalosiphum maidis]